MICRRILLMLALACLPAVGAISQSDDQPFAQPGSDQLERLREGEWVLEKDVSDENGAAASILILIRAPVEKIWEKIVSCRYAEAFVDGLEFCEVLEDNGTYAVTHQVVDKGWMTPTMDYTFETRREPYRHMAFKMLEGNLRTMQGTWDFQTLPDGILVRHVLVLRPQVPAPRWLVRRNMKKDLPNMMRCIRGLAESDGPGKADPEDLDKCPGKPG